ncbi:MAG: Uma2 family endonuclease [Dehalococcoidia bacterium]
MVEQRVTPAEYLTIDRRDEWKNEYVDGYVVAMPAVNADHNLVTMDVLVTLALQLRDGLGDIFSSRMRVRNVATGRYIFSDVVAVDGEPAFESDADGTDDTLLNPTLIVEVVSPSSEAYDRGDKFADYRRLPSLQEYVLIAQDRVSVEHYLRQGEHWLLTAASDLDATVSLTTIGCTLPLREVYRRVRLSGEAAQ